MKRTAFRVALLTFSLTLPASPQDCEDREYAAIERIQALVPSSQIGEDGQVEGTMTLRVFRPVRELEQPFHLVPPIPPEPMGTPEERRRASRYRAVASGPGAYLLSGPLSSQEPFSRFEVPDFYGSDLGEQAICGTLVEAEGGVYQALDDFTGNLFVATTGAGLLTLEALSPEGRLLARVRLDPFSDEAPMDLTGICSEGEMESLGTGGAACDGLAEAGPASFSWLNEAELATFVSTYRRLGGADYARFLVDACLAAALADAGTVRLPSLPPRATEGRSPGPIHNLGGLQTMYYQGRGRTCSIHPVLKILEDRDCRSSSEEDTEIAPQSCPAYSPPSVITHLLDSGIEEGKFHRKGGSIFRWVAESIAENGTCDARFYPDLPLARQRKLPSSAKFARFAEKELNRILAEQDRDYADFLDATPSSRIDFQDSLPPLCARQAVQYRSDERVSLADFVDVMAARRAIDSGQLGKEGVNTLHAAQRQELMTLLDEALGRGLPVAVAGGDEGVIRVHGVLVYGREGGDYLAMDSAAGAEAAERLERRIPALMLADSIGAVFFDREGVGRATPTVPQLRRALTLAPDYSRNHWALARLLEDEDQDLAAAAHYRRVTELEPDFRPAWEELGHLLVSVGRPTEAREALERAVGLGSEGDWIHRQLGHALHLLGRLEEAEVELRRALDENPDNPWSWHWLAWLKADAGRPDEAVGAMETANSLRPDELWWMRKRADLLYDMGKPDRARAIVLEWMETHPENRDDGRLGSSLWVYGFRDEGLEVLERSLRADPDSDWSRLQIARLYAEQDRPREDMVALLQPAETRLRERLEEHPEDLEAMMDMAYVELFTGRVEGARTRMQAMLDREPPLPAGDSYDAACVLALLGEREKALSAVRLAIEGGYANFRWMRRDPDLAILRDDPEFLSLTRPFGRED